MLTLYSRLMDYTSGYGDSARGCPFLSCFPRTSTRRWCSSRLWSPPLPSSHCIIYILNLGEGNALSSRLNPTFLCRYPANTHLSSTIAELQSENAEYLAQKKAEALDAMAMLEETVQRKLEQERTNEGKSPPPLTVCAELEYTLSRPHHCFCTLRPRICLHADGHA